MTNRCDGCARWTTKRVTRYGDGSEIVNWESPAGMGECAHLTKRGGSVPTVPAPEPVLTDADFGCNAYASLSQGYSPILVVETKVGAPWQHWKMISCPSCGGDPSQNGVARCKCAGTGIVRLYDDGVTGDEQSRMHPKEKEMLARSGGLKPPCQSCGKPMELAWVACPHCGRSRELPAKTEVVGLDLDRPQGAA